MSGDQRGRALRKTLAARGWTLVPTRGGHWRATHPAIPDGFLVVPATPSSYRSEANCLSLAARMVRAARVDSSA